MTRKSTESEGESASREPASEVYGGMVADIIAGTPRESDWVPAQPMDLRIVRRRMPKSLDQLEPDERLQLAAMFYPEKLETIIAADYLLDDFPLEIEVAAVEDDSGIMQYRLYGWNFGVGYLMPASGVDVVAMGCQHDLEHWNLSQRDVFWAMDRAYRRPGHGWQQPLKFCWWEQKCWDEVAAAPPGSLQSEPYIRKGMAEAAAALAK